MNPRALPSGRRGRPRLILLGVVLLVLFFFSRSICSLIIDYLWWSEMGQVPTWFRMSAYKYVTAIAEWVLVFATMWIAHARGMAHAGARLRDYRWYARLSTLGLAFIAFIVSAALMNGWLVALFVAGRGVESVWRDPIFGKALSFYFFELPFYTHLVGVFETLAVVGGLAYYLAARGWQARLNLGEFRGQFDWTELKTLGKMETGLLQFLMAAFLGGLAVSYWLDRFQLLYSDHGNLLVGMDYIDQNLSLPLIYVKIGACILAAGLILVKKRRWALACAVVLIFDIAIPPLVSSLYVKPNELTLERPFLEHHIEATRSAFGLTEHLKEVDYAAHKDGQIDFTKNQPMLDNVRLWDWRAFHDTLSQSQPLRPYQYADTDVDRYIIDGKQRLTLLAPREMDLNQLGAAQESWINANLTYTHGYGLVLAEASKISPAGLPELLMKNAPVEVLNPSLKLTRPELYYSEKAHEPVFAPTQQDEFNYPSGSSDIKVHYEGKGGFPITGAALRVVAAIAQGDWNIYLTDSIRPDSRMLIHRRVLDRLGTLAEFIRWDDDPYLVITDAGRLQWIVDGYMTSDAHPYSREIAPANEEPYNYIRNSIKATVDAYDGTVKMYVFDEKDPMIQAYRRLFPDLFTPAAEMPADLRAHTRAPETLFRVQAEIYRTYHMRDPEAFYNRADLWDLATSSQQGAAAAAVAPVYMVATLPGEAQPEFLLTIPFTPRNKQNLIGVMATRCDGDKLGEIVLLQLPKQEIISGPLQVDALINQDQVISKDLTLWNQQGSQVLRPPILTLPIDHTFLYVAPLFIQASEARMPQLKKVVLAVGNTLVYEDTYEKALAALAAAQGGRAPVAEASAVTQVSGGAAPAAQRLAPEPRLDEIRTHMQRYKELMAQGKMAEAGKELEAIDAAVKK
jgi:uncharacterized protein